MRSFFSVIGTPVGMLLLTAALLPLFAQGVACVTARRQERGRGFRIGMTALFTADILLLSLLLDAAFLPDYLPPRSFSAFASRVYGLPWPWIAVMIALALLAAGVCLYSCRRYGETHVSAGSVKEAVDLLPVGICFGRGDGAVALANVRMTDWCYALTGGSLSFYDMLRDAVRDMGEARGRSTLVRLQEGSVLLFEEEEIDVDGTPFRQLTAADVTERFHITEELEAKNARLRDIQLRMKAYGVEAAALAMSKEILRARATVHDEVNHVLLRIRHYLDHPEGTDAEALIKLIRQTNGLLLREAEEPDDARRDGWEDAVALASGIGVKPEVTGTVPEDEGLRTLLGGALRECAVNAAKHAGADRLYVSVEEGPNSVAVTFLSAGAAREPVRETGGLRMLRRSVEEAGGTMLVRAGPDFSVTVILPKNDLSRGE